LGFGFKFDQKVLRKDEPEMMEKQIISLKDINKNDLNTVGGKGANLGELYQIGIPIPEGFCVTTFGYNNLLKNVQAKELFVQLKNLRTIDIEKIKNISKEIRDTIVNTTINNNLKKKIITMTKKLDKNNSFAVRSSATTEDLPTASFAGQYETYLNVKGVDNIIQKIKSTIKKFQWQ
jgi:pyruvate,water dikinase